MASNIVGGILALCELIADHAQMSSCGFPAVVVLLLLSILAPKLACAENGVGCVKLVYRTGQEQQALFGDIAVIEALGV